MGDEEATVTGIASTASTRCSSPTIELKKVGNSWKIKVDGQYLKVPANTFSPTEHIEVDGSHILTESDCYQVTLDSSGKWHLYRSEEISVEERNPKQNNASEEGTDAGIEDVQYETGSTEFESLQSDTADSGRQDHVKADDAVPGRQSTNVQTSSDWHLSMVDIACGPDDAVRSRKSHDLQTSSDSHVSMVDKDCGPGQDLSSERTHSLNDARERQRLASSGSEGPSVDDDEHLKVEVVIEARENDGECREYIENVPVNVEDYLKLQFIRNNPNLIEHTQSRHGQVAVTGNKKNKLKVFLDKAFDDSDNAVLARTILKYWIANDTRFVVNSMPIGQQCIKHLIAKLLELDMVKKNQLLFYHTKNDGLLSYVCMESNRKEALKIISDVFKTILTKCDCPKDENPEKTEMLQEKGHKETAEVTKVVELNLVFQTVFEDEASSEVVFEKFKTYLKLTQDRDNDLLICKVVGPPDVVDETVQWLQAYTKGYFSETLNFDSIQHAETFSVDNLSSMLQEFMEDEDEGEVFQSEVHWTVNDKARTVSLCSKNKDRMLKLKKKAINCLIQKSVIVGCDDKDDLDDIMKDLSGEKLRWPGKVVVKSEVNKMYVLGLEKHVHNVIKDLKSKRDELLAKRVKVSEKQNSQPPPSTTVRPVTVKVSCQDEMDFLMKTVGIGQEVKEKFSVEVKKLDIKGKFGVLLEGSSDDVANAAEYLGSVACQTVEVYPADEEKLHKVIASNEEVKVKVSDPSATSDTPMEVAIWLLKTGHQLKLSACEVRSCWKDLLVKRLVTTTKEDTKPALQNLQDQKKKIQLNVPSIEGKEKEKEKHYLGDGFDHILDQAMAHDCSHVCLSLEPIGGWQPDTFLKAIFPSIRKLATAECLPMTVEVCVVGSQMYDRCKCIITDALRMEPDGEPFTASGSPPMKSEELHVDIVLGELSKAQVDVIVNSTSKELHLDSGAISKSLLQAAGIQIQKEIKMNYPRGTASGEVAETSSFKLPCQRVFHCVIEPFQYSKSVNPIEEIVMKCLLRADEAGFKSIAFPALGTGNLGYPKDKVAEAMLTVIRDFVGSSLREVKIVIYTKDTETYQKFMDVKKTGCLRAITKTCTPDIVLGKLSVHANVGPLSQVQADSLIYLWDKNYMYNLKVKDHKVLKEMPQEVQQFSRHRDSKLDRYRILTTKGGNIGVKMVFHIPCDMNDLQAALAHGLQKADVGQSAVIFFESTHPFLVLGSKLGECLFHTISNVSPSLKNLRRVVVNLESKISAEKVMEYFKSRERTMTTPLQRRKFTVMLGGPRDEVEKVALDIKALEENHELKAPNTAGERTMIEEKDLKIQALEKRIRDLEIELHEERSRRKQPEVSN